MPPTSAQRQVKGVADKRHQHHLTFGQLVAAVGTTQQIIAAVHQVAHDNQPRRAQQHHPVIVADDLPHLFPVHFLRVDHQQHRDGNKEYPVRIFLPDASVDAILTSGFASVFRFNAVLVSISGCTGGSTCASFGVCAGSQPTIAGKCRRKWNTTTLMPRFHQCVWEP